MYSFISIKVAEATEELVKVYLEMKGYLVTLSKRVDVRTSKNSPRSEIDVVAVRTAKNKSNDGLPSRIAGEVKSFKINQRGFEKLDKKLRKKYGYRSRKEYGGYKWLNNKQYGKDILDSLNKEYGFKDFTFVLFCDGVKPKKYEEQIKEFLKEEKVKLVSHSDVLKWIFENRTNEYTNSEILQLIRLIKKNAKKN